MTRHPIILGLLAVVSVLWLVVSAQTLAFPSAEGFGKYAKGGRGGKIIEVTNLNDAGPGSLREALTANGPRIIVFRVGGAIELKSDIQINYGNVTVAGQTAPGGGIAINHGWLNFRCGEVIIRHVRVRNGNPGVSSQTATIYIWNPDPAYHNNDNTLWSENAIIDHVSSSWASDDAIGVWGRCRNITIQWSISAENSGPMLIHNQQQGTTIHHNLLATNNRRYPSGGGKVDVVNNVMYNYPRTPTLISGFKYQGSKPAFGNIVNNYYKDGPWTKSHSGYWGPNPGEVHLVYVCNETEWPQSCASSNGTEMYVRGNMLRRNGASADEPARTYKENHNYTLVNGVIKEISTRHPYPEINMTSAAQAYTDVLAKSGAFPRDSVDARIIGNARNQTSIYPYTWTVYATPTSNWDFKDWDPNTAVGWPKPVGGTPLADTDHDGMPDEWEKKNSFNPNSATDGPQDKDGDGYTNVEEYLNELADKLVGGTTTEIGAARPNVPAKSVATRKAKQCPLDIFGRTISSNSQIAGKKAFSQEIMNRKLSQQ